MMDLLFSQEEAMNAYVYQEKEASRTEGKAIVYHEEMGLNADQIASKLGITTEEVNAILTKNNLVSEPVHQYKTDKAEKTAPKGPKI